MADPAEVRTANGQTVFTEADIQTGRKVWQTIGGQQIGSIWGHGSYVAPDWSADWLHRESVALLDLWAVRDTGRKYDELDPPQQASLQARLQAEVRANTYDAGDGRRDGLRGPRRRHRARSPTTTTGCSATIRRCRRCARSTPSRRTRFRMPAAAAR